MECSCGSKINNLQLRLAVQQIEMDSKLIRQGAMQQFGLTNESELTSNHLADHYIASRRAQEISDLFSEENYSAVKQKLDLDPQILSSIDYLATLSPIEYLEKLWEELHSHHPGVSKPLLLLNPDLASFD